MRRLALATVMLLWASETAQAQETPAAEPPQPEGASATQLQASPLQPPTEQPRQDLGAAAADPDALTIRDPWEGFNRRMYAFNNVLDTYVLAPAAIAYAKATPRPLRRGISNALDNVSSPVVFANDIMQLKFKRAGVTLGRLIVNSTVGVGGFIDVGARLGLERHDEDFGQTLAVWGAPSGPYLYLPFLGPSSVRDGVGIPADIALDPLTWTQFGGFRVLRFSRVGLGALDARSEALRPLAEIKRTSPDPYVTIRTLYSLSRRSSIRDGRENVEELPEFGDPLEFEDEPGGAATEEPAPEVSQEPEEVAVLGPQTAWSPAPAPAFGLGEEIRIVVLRLDGSKQL